MIIPYVDFNIGSRHLSRYDIGSLPDFLFIYESMLSIGPGLYKAIAAIKSSSELGFSFFRKFFIPGDSN